MTFKKTLLSRFWTGFILSSLGIGALGCTLLLTNINKNANSLYSLELQDKPEIPELEIKPVIKQQPPPPPIPPNIPPPAIPHLGTPSRGDGNPPEDITSHESSYEGTLDVKELIKLLIQEANGSDWFRTTDQLGSVYSIVNSFGKLNKHLEEFKQQIEKDLEGKQN